MIRMYFDSGGHRAAMRIIIEIDSRKSGTGRDLGTYVGRDGGHWI